MSTSTILVYKNAAGFPMVQLHTARYFNGPVPTGSSVPTSICLLGCEVLDGMVANIRCRQRRLLMLRHHMCQACL